MRRSVEKDVDCVEERAVDEDCIPVGSDHEHFRPCSLSMRRSRACQCLLLNFAKEACPSLPTMLRLARLAQPVRPLVTARGQARRSLVSPVLLTRTWENESVATLRKEAKNRGLSAYVVIGSMSSIPFPNFPSAKEQRPT